MTLEAKALFGYPNRAANATFTTAGAFTTTLPLSNLTYRQIAKVARCVDADSRNSRFYMDLGEDKQVAVLDLIGHNMTSSADVRWRGFSADPRPVFEAVFTHATLSASFVFGRSTVARNFDITGVNVSTAAGTHRINYVPATHRARGVLLEGAATNYIIQCRNSTGWTVVNGSLGTAVGLDGVAASCMLLTASSANCELKRSASAAGAAGGAYVLSFWVYGVVLTGAVALSIDNFTSATTVTATVGQWTRVSMSGTYASGNVGIRLAASGDSIRVDFGQFEPTASTGPTSEILTTTASVTRSADSMTITDVSALGLTQASMTMCARFRLARLPSGASNVMGLQGGGTHFIGIEMDPSGLVHAYILNAAVSQANISGPTMVVGDYLTVAMTWAANNVRVSFNGGAVQTDTAATIPPSVQFFANGDQGIATEVERIQLWNGQRSDADLVALSGGGEDMAPAAGYDSGAVDAWHANFVAATTAEKRAGRRGESWHFPATPQTYRYWRVDMVDEANPSPLQAGRVLMSPTYQFAVNMAEGAGIRYVDRDLHNQTDSGAKLHVRRPGPITQRFTLDRMDDAALYGEVLEMQRQLGTSGELFFSRNPLDTTYGPNHTWLCTMRELGEAETPYCNEHQAGYQLEQAL